MDHDIVISGGGLAGLAAAAAFGRAGFDVLCVDPAAPVTERNATGADLRSTAFLQPSRDFLAEIGLWDRLFAHAMPLQVMRIVDAGGDRPEPRIRKDFDAADISERPFGWNLPNWLLGREMAAHLADQPGVTHRTGIGTRSVFTRDAEARVTLTDGTKVRCRMVIGADGRNSPVRRAMGIGARTTRFGQKALAFAVTHPVPHDNVSTEIHRTGGPFTFVPLPDHEGAPSSAIVWMEEGPTAERLHAMDIPDFEAAMTERSCGLFGPLTLASNRTIWPIVAQEASQITAQRVALVAEAAHVMPPIGAQGLNMSLRDIATLRDLAMADPDALGGARMLDAYAAARMPDIRLRVAGITALNRASMVGARPLRDVRAAGLNALYSVTPVRHAMMQLGLGARG